MSDKLICGCGGEVEIQHSYSKLAAKIFYYAECPVCGLQISTRYSKKYDSKEELSSAFRLATRADKYEQPINIAIDAIIDELQGGDNEATRAPYWIIVDPHQMFTCDVHYAASMITGIFFSRKDAEEFLQRTRYNFSKHAKVYCHSGHNSAKYESLCDALNL